MAEKIYSEPKSAIEIMSEKLPDIKFEDLSERNIKILKDKLIDTVGCIIGGANVNGNQELLDIIRDWDGKEEAPIFVHGGRALLGDAAMMNCVSCRSNDFDSMVSNIDGQRLPTHISGTTMPTALTLSDMFDTTGKELLVTALIGEDVTLRVATAGGMWNFNLGWDGSYCLPIWGAIAQIGRLRGLSAKQIKNAWGIGFNMIAGSIQNIYDYATAFKLGQGSAARNADFAVRLAQAGWNGVNDPLTGDKNFYFLYRGMEMPCRPEILTNEFGKKFYMEESFKLFPCGIPSIPIVISGINLASNGLKCSDIKEIELILASDVTTMYYTKEFELGSDPVVNAMYSYQFALCVALLRGRFRIEDFKLDAIMDKDLLEAIKKTKMIIDPEMESRHIRVRVTSNDGKVYEDYRATMFDMHQYPSHEQLVAKYWDQVNASGIIPKAKAKKMLDMMEKIEDVNSMKEFTELLMP